MDTSVVLENKKVEVRREGVDLLIHLREPHIIRIKANDPQAIDDEVIRMLKMRTIAGEKYFVQKEVGAIIGVSRQMINRRWQVYRNEGLVALLAGEWEKSKLTPELLEWLARTVVENPFLHTHEIKEKAREEGIVETISEASLRSAVKRLDGRALVMLMRGKASKQKPEAFMEAGYLIERLFRIIEELLNTVPRKTSEPIIKNSVYEQVNRLFRARAGVQRGPTEKDRYCPRKKLERDRRRNRGFLKALLERMKPTLRCPDCHSPQIHFVFKRPRMYVDKRGKKHHDYSRIYRCLNSCCRTKYFTVPPKGVELYARVHREVKKMVFRWIFHLRGSLSRVRDELSEHGINVSLTTVLRWVKKAGEECVEALTLGNWELWRQPLCIDEKWIKVRNQWHYVFTAVGTIVTDLLAMDLFRHKDRFSIRAFLLKLKALGFDPVSITTDLLLGYENEVKEVFPQCTYHQCVLHAGRDAKRIVRQSLPDEGEECWRRRLIRSLTLLFKSKKMKQVKKRYRRFMLLKLNAPEDVQKVFSMVEHYFPKLCQAVRQKELPQTTNPVERAIGEFEERYQLMKGFTSFYYAQFFLKAFQIYYRLRKISFGPLKGRNRLEVKHNPIGKLNFADYLAPVISL